VNWLLAFQACNACNFTIGLGAPLILTARYLKASEEQIGILNGIAPLMVALQLFATNWMVRLGYRRMMLMGWSTRSFMLLLITPLPFLVGAIPEAVLSWALIVPIFLFNLFRGLASGAWLPWLKALLPEGERGKYLAREQVTMNVSGFLTLQLCAAVLGESPGPFQFSILFVLAWGAGMASVFFLKRAPEIMPGADGSEKERSFGEVLKGTLRVLRHAPFRAATLFGGLHVFALAALPGFLVIYVREDLGWSEGGTMQLQSMTTVGVLITALVWGALCERYGSRPVLRLTLWGQLTLLTFWIAAAAALPVSTMPALLTVFFLWGSLSSAQAIAQTRLTLDTSPPEDVTLSMPVYQVCLAVASGAGPMIWGVILDRLRHPPTNAEVYDPAGPYSVGFLVFFGAALALLFVAHLLLSRVRERSSFSTGRMILNVGWDWPTRVLSPIMIRRKGE